MIFYFSGTGNSRWVAEQLADLTDDQTFDITAREEIPDIKNASQVGFVFPVYAWRAPEVMLEFAKILEKTHFFTFGICTCGQEAGLAMKNFPRIYPLDSSYSIVMPNNYIIGSDTDDRDSITIKIRDARDKLHKIAEEILNREKTYKVHEGSLARLKSGVVNFGFNRFARRTGPFYVSDSCISCGQCADDCPASAISMVNNLPVWGNTCYQCMRCINECPREAVQFGKSTLGRRRYSILPYLPDEEKNR